jgi:anthranilate synthase component 2
MKILIIDNYDSFTFNLYQMVGEVLSLQKTDFYLDVIRNNELSLDQIKNKNYDKFIISPGPGDSKDEKYFGVCSKVILELGKTKPVFGVCLGMQGICHYFGGEVIRAKQIMHGKTSKIKHNKKGLFKNLPQSIEVMRYHSLIPNPNKMPDCLEITATVENENPDQIQIMALKHKKYPISGVQFHPESFATEGGKQIIKNFIDEN